MAHGKICYLQIPTTNVAGSAAFYRAVFDWRIRTRGDGETAFDDTTGAVSGAWVLGRPPDREPGVLIYIMVDSVEETLAKIANAGGKVVAPPAPIGKGREAIARFADPAGNVFGIYQE